MKWGHGKALRMVHNGLANQTNLIIVSDARLMKSIAVPNHHGPHIGRSIILNREVNPIKWVHLIALSYEL